MTNANNFEPHHNRSDGTAYLPLAIERQKPRKTRGKIVPKLLRVAGKIPFADDLAAAYYCALDAKTPRKAKAILFGALAYFVAPTDAIPDIVVALGFTDDATVLATALGIVGMHVREEHRMAARKLLGIKASEGEITTPAHN